MADKDFTPFLISNVENVFSIISKHLTTVGVSNEKWCTTATKGRIEIFNGLDQRRFQMGRH